MKRKIIIHRGPTNSGETLGKGGVCLSRCDGGVVAGKTYQAIQRMMEAKSGMFLAPLR